MKGKARNTPVYNLLGGGHTDAPNMNYFITWTEKFIGYTSPS